MVRKLTIVVFMVALGASCLAQDGLVIRTNGRQERPADAESVYISACSAVEREFRISRPLRPQVTLVIGANKNGVIGALEKSGLPSGTRTCLRKGL